MTKAQQLLEVFKDPEAVKVMGDIIKEQLGVVVPPALTLLREIIASPAIEDLKSLFCGQIYDMTRHFISAGFTREEAVALTVAFIRKTSISNK